MVDIVCVADYVDCFLLKYNTIQYRFKNVKGCSTNV